MLAHEIFKSMSSALSLSIVEWMRAEEKPVFKATLASLAQQRRLRPVFVERKPRGEQAQWIADNLKIKLSEAVGENVLQIWLLKKKQDMLVAFLNKVGIPHDGQGAVDGEMPKELDAAKVEQAVGELAEKFPVEEAAVYLHLFQLQQPGGWPAVTDALAAHPAVKLGE